MQLPSLTSQGELFHFAGDQMTACLTFTPRVSITVAFVSPSDCPERFDTKAPANFISWARRAGYGILPNPTQGGQNHLPKHHDTRLSSHAPSRNILLMQSHDTQKNKPHSYRTYSNTSLWLKLYIFLFVMKLSVTSPCSALSQENS